MKNYSLRLLIGAATSAGLVGVLTTGCAANAEGHGTTANDQVVITDTLSQACASVGALNNNILADEATAALLGREPSVQTKNRKACADYNAGVALSSLAALPTTWDAKCLQSEGWTLDGNQTPLPQGYIQGNRYYPAEVAHCGTPSTTEGVCESVREAVAPQQAALSPEIASLITTFGCNNVAVEGFMGGH